MMKNWLIYFVAVTAAVQTVACEKSDEDGYAAGEGGVVMNLANTRAEEASGLKLADCTTFIYQKGTDADTSEPVETLVRMYEHGNCPAKIKLLAGNYSAKVQWGEKPKSAHFDNYFYEGSKDFTITAGQTVQVTVSCKPQSAAVRVEYASNIAEKLTGYAAVVALPDDNDPNTTDALTFSESRTGYFTLPEGVATLDWSFAATHSETKVEIHKSGKIVDVEAGKRYTLKFSYSDDLPGYISIGIEIDKTTDYYSDVMVFSQDPEMNGEILNSTDANPQDFTNSGTALTMKANGKATVDEASIYVVEDLPAVAAMAATRAATTKETLVWDWKTADINDSRVKAELSSDGTILKVTLSPAFFSFPIGDTKLCFKIKDSNQGTSNKTATIRVNEGIRSVVPESDCDLWANTVTLHAVSSNGAPTFKLRQKGTTAWKTLTGIVATAENEYTATFAAEWSASKNVNNLDVYEPVEYTGVWAGHTYEAAVEIGGHEYFTSFVTSNGDAIPNGDMENKDASCYGTENSDASKVIWGSGNNSITSSLCKPATKTGMGGANCSKLAAAYKFSNMAAGNLFLGTFTMNGTKGTVDFGIKYTYTARPKGLRFKYHAKIGNVEYNQKNGPLPVGNPDQASVYFTIMDWSVRRAVTSGVGTPAGMWSADAQADLAGCGAILGYGTMFISGETEGESMIEGYIPVQFYDKDAGAPQGNYTLTIACSTSRYGDYMNGNSENVLYVDDFEWVY